MMTIYGGTTRNGICIQDMVDNNSDYIYRNTSFKGYFARFTQYLRNENDFGSGGPAIAIFADSKPYIPILAKPLPEPWDAYTDQYGQMTDSFLEQLKVYWEEVKEEAGLTEYTDGECPADPIPDHFGML